MRVAHSANLAVAWLTMFLVGTELFVISPLLPVFAAAFDISLSLAGLSVTIFSATYMISAPILGRFADRVGRSRVLTCSLVAFAVTNLATACATDLPSLLVGRALAGAVAAGVSPSIYAVVSAAAPPERRATWLATAASGLLVSLALGASVGGLVGTLFGWAPVFMTLAGLSLLLAWLNRRVWPLERSPDDRGANTGVDRLSARTLAIRLLPMLVWSTGLYSVYTYLGAALSAAGFSAERAAEAILLYGSGSLAGVLIGGRAADRFGVKLTIGASFAGFCACLLLLRLALDAGRLIEPAIGISSAVAQLFFPAQQAGLASDFPRQRSTVLAWNNSALFGGISLGSLMGGQAITLAGFDTNLTISAGIALIGCVITAITFLGRQRFGIDKAKIRVSSCGRPVDPISKIECGR
jgi:predicted MFS family arabinose efflux permease